MTTTTIAKGEQDLKNMTLGEKVKFYVSLCLGTTALLSVFVFLFLIPFVVDPSITTIMANFDSTPVACVTSRHIYAEGLSNCTWTSCKEGCTSATPRCHQIYVNYSAVPYTRWKEDSRRKVDLIWTTGPVKFFVNTDGCGYPPRINCTEFARQYGSERDKENTVFPCYYSKRYPRDRAVAVFDWDDTIKNLVLAIGVPNLLFALSVGVLSYWYCWPNFYYDRRPHVLSTTYTTFDSEDVDDADIDGTAANNNSDADADIDEGAGSGTSTEETIPETLRDLQRRIQKIGIDTCRETRRRSMKDNYDAYQTASGFVVAFNNKNYDPEWDRMKDIYGRDDGRC